MSDEMVPTVTDADIRTLAAKLKGLHALLTPGEQVLLQAALRRAAGHEEVAAPDTEGFAWAVSFNPFPYLDAIALDVGGAGGHARSNAEGSTTMTTEQDMAMVFKDAAGEYYLVPLETLKQGRVPAEQRAEVERLIAAAQDDAGDADVQGHILGIVFGGFVAYSVGLVGGFAVTQGILDGQESGGGDGMKAFHEGFQRGSGQIP